MAFPRCRSTSLLSRCALTLAITLIAALCHGAEPIKLPGLEGQVNVESDEHGVPHIYAESWVDAARVLGYLHARDRLWQMDMFRRQASGTTAEVLGKQGLDNDIQMRRLGIRRGCETMWKSGELPKELRDELEAYAGGVNARMSELGDTLPAAFDALGYKPEPWSPVDSLVFSKYMGWDQSGTDDDLWFGTMVEKLGVTAVEELWPLERPYEIPTVTQQAPMPGRPARAQLEPLRGCGPAYAAAHRALEKVRSPWRGLSYGSNNWAVDGTKTASGKPIVCNDPHLGFRLPSIWYTCHTSVLGENIAGVTFPGGPVTVIGFNDHIGWGVTNLQADAVDYFVETVDKDDSLRYRHRGEWKQMDRATETIPVRGEESHTLVIESTVHGPVISREGRTISMQWTGLPPTKDICAFWRVSHSKNLTEFLQSLDDLTVPALNMVYADDAGNIAVHPCGALPIRMRGAGRIPMEGASGEHDWSGTIPRNRMPLAVNPAEHFVASANNRPTPMDYPLYLGWMWDVNYRIRRIHDMLAGASNITVESMQAIQTDAYDKAAERFVPPLVDALAQSGPMDPTAERALAELKQWDYVATTEALGPVIWLRWLQHYRRAVWDDEWASRDIKQPGGSWGFSGANHREPMLEVLESMTREVPDSIWFDDRNTPQRETRDAIIRRSFASAVESLAKDFGDDPAAWRWGNINQLRINSLSGQPELARQGGPVVGTEFTVNPGSDIGTVGGGASWRMIVDMASTGHSVGVYPGGQSDDPASPLYDDQMRAWAKGEYLPIHMIARARLKQDAKTTSIEFVP